MNVYLAFFRRNVKPAHHAVIHAPDLDQARAETLRIRNEHCPGCVCDTLLMAGERGVNPRAINILQADFPETGYLGLFVAEDRPPRFEVILEAEPGDMAVQAAFIRRQLIGYSIISIRELA